jgi:hypothetical protein
MCLAIHEAISTQGGHFEHLLWCADLKDYNSNGEAFLDQYLCNHFFILRVSSQILARHFRNILYIGEC